MSSPLPHSKGLTPKGYSPTTFPRPHKSVESPAYPAVEGPTNRKAKRERCKERRRERLRAARSLYVGEVHGAKVYLDTQHTEGCE